MAYTPLDWQENSTPLSAQNFDHMEEGIKDAHDAIEIENAVKTLATSMGWTASGEDINSLIYFLLQQTKANSDRIHISTTPPTSEDGENGDIWFVYEA